MVSFECDYIAGAHPEILKRLAETNMESLPGYGMDHYTENAKEKIKAACGLPDAQVELLVYIVDVLRIPVIAYGLRADFRGNLFEGSQWLLAWADSIEEIKTVCWCGKKATFNARVQNGKVVKAGDQIMLGGNESYTALCRKHWAEGKLGPDT